jgi:hypothetical protein
MVISADTDSSIGNVRKLGWRWGEWSVSFSYNLGDLESYDLLGGLGKWIGPYRNHPIEI